MVREQQARVASAGRNARLIWMTLVGMVLGLVAAVTLWHWVDPAFSGFAGEALPLDLLRYAFGAAAVMASVGAFVVRGLLMPKRLPGAGEDEDPERSAQREFAAHLVALTLADNVAILGFVLFLLWGRPWDCYLFALPGLAVLLALRPGSGGRRL